jgi:hypothetical protein
MSEMESGKAVVASKLVVDYCVDCAMTTDLNGLVVVVAKEPAFT